jgi:hypothetical protein
MVTSVETTGGTFRAGSPRVLFEENFRGGMGGIGFAGNTFADYEVTADAQRFIMFPGAENAEQEERPHVTLVTHWFEDLRRTFATGED